MSKAVKIEIYEMMVKPAVVCGVKHGRWLRQIWKDPLGEENIKKSALTCGRARNMESKN